MTERNIIITSSKNSDIMLYYYSGHKGVLLHGIQSHFGKHPIDMAVFDC